MCKKCVTPEIAKEIELVQLIAGDYPEGAYFAFCAEHRVTPEDLAAYYDDHQKVKNDAGSPA